MFKFLKDKLKSWLRKSKEVEEKPEKKSKKEETKEKQGKKLLKIEHRKRSEKELKEEREISQEIREDIIKEGIEIKSPEQRFEEQIKPVEKEKKGFFSRLKERFSYKLTEEDFNRFFEELELILLENNVALEVVEKIQEELKKEIVNKEIKKQELEEKIKSALKLAIENVLIEPFNLIEKIKNKEGVFVIVFFGINGTGKTTTIAKIANLLLKNKISCVLSASDTFRAASIEQLQKHADNLKINMIKHKYGSDPASVAYDAVQHAKAHKIKAVLIDTAGRMHTKENLMSEMEKIIRVIKPDLKVFIAESITGNDAIEQAKTFNETVGIDAIILTKADVDEKAGTILSVSFVTSKPIIYLGTGQKYSDLMPFDKKKVLEGLGL